MNLSGSTGESSCKRQENGDASAGSDRPLKKARFAWQVKGKYHLKNGIPETGKSPSTAACEPERSSSFSENENEHIDQVGSTEKNLERLGDYLLKQDFNTLDSLIADSESSLLKPSSNLSADKMAYPRYAGSFENSNCNIRSTACSSSQDQNLRSASKMLDVLVMPPDYNEDRIIGGWQAMQTAKAFVDNTINRVLESWMVAPLPDERFLALDVAEFINNLPGDNSIENEGILMAISAHGLQNQAVLLQTASGSSDDDSQMGDQTCSYMHMKDDAFPSPPSSPIQSDDRITKEPLRNNQGHNGGSPNNADIPWHPSMVYDAEDDVNSSSTDSLLTGHYDFLDAAVSFAIQNKGLTSFGSDYG